MAMASGSDQNDEDQDGAYVQLKNDALSRITAAFKTENSITADEAKSEVDRLRVALLTSPDFYEHFPTPHSLHYGHQKDLLRALAQALPVPDRRIHAAKKPRVTETDELPEWRRNLKRRKQIQDKIQRQYRALFLALYGERQGIMLKNWGIKGPISAAPAATTAKPGDYGAGDGDGEEEEAGDGDEEDEGEEDEQRGGAADDRAGASSLGEGLGLRR
jgi:hypothetical protein